MSQRSKITRSQKIVQSQNRASQQSQGFSQSQQTQSVSNDIVQKCVRYFLLKMSSNIPIKRAQIVQALFKEKPGKTFDQVIKKAAYILDQDYGLKLQLLEADSTKKYVLINNLEEPGIVFSNDKSYDLQSTVTFLVLTHVFMSKNCATEVSLWEFLKGVHIYPEQKLSECGTVSLFVTKQLVKEQYIQFETVGSTTEDGETRKKLSWGARAEACVSKMEILKFVAKMHGNANVKSWTSRYEEALEQRSEDQNEVEIMAVDD